MCSTQVLDGRTAASHDDHKGHVQDTMSGLPAHPHPTVACQKFGYLCGMRDTPVARVRTAYRMEDPAGQASRPHATGIMVIVAEEVWSGNLSSITVPSNHAQMCLFFFVGGI